MSIESVGKLQNKKLAMLGLGLENYALIRFLLRKKVNCQITICDAREDILDKYPDLSARKNISWQLGEDYNKYLHKFDVIFRSPGWPLDCGGIKKALAMRKNGVKQDQSPKLDDFVSSPVKLFFELCPTKNIIGVTGTKGKGTTGSLIAAILKQAGKKVWLGGNIGIAPFDFIGKIKHDDWVVLELSSFQLEDLAASPHIAVITNFYAEHLAPADPHNPNFHKSINIYRNAKKNIFKRQKPGDYLILNSKFSNKFPAQKLKSRVIYFEKSDLRSNLVGEHNKENIAAAVEAVKIAGVKMELIKKAVKEFKGLEHRLELAGEVRKVKFYDDSFATTPEATMTALESFSAPIVLLAGGAEKKADFRSLAGKINKKVKYVVLLDGAATPRLKAELKRAGLAGSRIGLVHNMEQAIKLAMKQAVAGDVVLLSTACASFGMFRNYKERGDLFKRQVGLLK